jgi:hypothetical protein
MSLDKRIDYWTKDTFFMIPSMDPSAEFLPRDRTPKRSKQCSSRPNARSGRSWPIRKQYGRVIRRTGPRELFSKMKMARIE